MTHALKAAAIDSQNFWGCYRDQGFDEIDHGRLMGYLKRKVGTVPSISSCVSTLRPEFCCSAHRVFTDMRRAGITPIPASQDNNQDDLVVKQQVTGFIQAPQISEVILISCDHDIVAQALATLVLWTKKGKTCHLFVIGTTAPGRSGRPRTGAATLSEIRSCADAEFVDMQPFLPLIARKFGKH